MGIHGCGQGRAIRVQTPIGNPVILSTHRILLDLVGNQQVPTLLSPDANRVQAPPVARARILVAGTPRTWVHQSQKAPSSNRAPLAQSMARMAFFPAALTWRSSRGAEEVPTQMCFLVI